MQNNQPEQPVIITQLQLPFIHLLWFLVKLMVAAIPALMIATIIITLAVMFVVGVIDVSPLKPGG